MERLDCIVQDYAWGDPTAIPELLGRPITGMPAAELWMGAHPKAPSTVVSGGATLDAVIAADPAATIGDRVAERFGQLPYLFKVLAAAQALSIQAHPSLDQAIAGFAREEHDGVALGAFDRTYRDPNHKPELMCALTPFAAKVGFKPLADARALFEALDGAEIDSLRTELAEPGSDRDVLAGALAWLLSLPADRAVVLTRAVVEAAATYGAGPFSDELAWCAPIAADYPDDIGGVVALLLNHVVLEPGEAVFLGAGNLHAYLRGTGIELMANSDNVVRGGLTPKNIDIPELLDVVDASPMDPEIQRPAGAIHTYASPVPEFNLTRVAGSGHLDSAGPRIVIVADGPFTVSTAADSDELVQGDVVFVPDADGPLRFDGSGLAFVAATGRIED